LPWEETQDYIRSGHRNPEDFEPDSLRTIWISEEEGIKAAIGKPKGETSTEVVSYLFMKEKGWTLEEAKVWFQKHQPETRHEHLYCLTPILEKIVEKPLKIRGVALTTGMSRNLNIYMEEELESLAPKLVGSPVYLEHVSALDAVGRVTNAIWDPDAKALFYEAEIHDDEAQEKIRKGLIQHVSVAADYDHISVLDGKIPHNLHNAELSLVAVPGIPETNITIMESLGNPEKSNSSATKEVEFEIAPEPGIADLIASVEEVVGQINEALKALTSRVEALEQGRVEESKGGRAVIAPEALEGHESFDLSKVRLRDVMKHLS
jgi:hypothetical protein